MSILVSPSPERLNAFWMLWGANGKMQLSEQWALQRCSPEESQETYGTCSLLRSKDVTKYSVLVGSLQISGHPDPRMTIIPVSRIITHPDFSGSIFGALAVVELAYPVSYGPVVLPICLPSSEVHLKNTSSCWVTGWGYSGTQQCEDKQIFLNRISSTDILSHYPTPNIRSPDASRQLLRDNIDFKFSLILCFICNDIYNKKICLKERDGDQRHLPPTSLLPRWLQWPVLG